MNRLRMRRFSRANLCVLDTIIPACIINTRHSRKAPLRVDREHLASPASCVPATQPYRCVAH
jgi:hypothetical protein